ncbi:SMP-30/gluconolactonase/LRE family protein [Segetibacter koreensis]|uniref:SMP-30/gluconolactonase/LRE family protein n=1 Tax=Segetibacter koreensis TaxID=398037 RepID=UPI000379206B|nr:SMP-30/gluconolactonase/LRE family protein [Segetibacter koreensis]
MKKVYSILIILSAVYHCGAQQTAIQQVTSLTPDFDLLIDKNAKIEILADSFVWAEGPVWVKDSNYLIFSDVKRNTIFKWKEGEGLSEFLKPSGYTGRMTYSDEPGSNGLTINKQGYLVACEHGDRRVSTMPLAGGGKRTLADNYRGKAFNSPNDIIQKSNGDYYFTDPAYGLPKDSAASAKVLGIYRISKNGVVTLLVDNMTPNGLAFSPDEKVLYVAQSLAKKPVIMSFPVKQDGTLGQGKVFFDASEMLKERPQDLPDGLKTDVHGNLFATGPGGVLVISPQGKLLGKIATPERAANCAWGDDGSTLYITASSLLCRIKTKTKGIGF